MVRILEKETGRLTDRIDNDVSLGSIIRRIDDPNKDGKFRVIKNFGYEHVDKMGNCELRIYRIGEEIDAGEAIPIQKMRYSIRILSEAGE